MSRKRIPVMTMYEPHATLTVLGLKGVETRPRRMRYRGPLLIHAAAKTPEWWMADAMLHNKELKDLLESELPDSRVRVKDLMSPGHIKGQVMVVDCKPVEELQVLSTRERALGDYSAGRYGIMLERAKRFKKPIKAKGKQGLWYRKGKS